MDRRKRTLLLITLFYLLSLNVCAANHVDDDSSTIEWSRVYGGAGNDGGKFILQTEDKGYVIVGYTDSFGVGDFDVYLLKMDVEGNLVWNKTYGGVYSDLGYSIKETSDGGFVIAGYTRSFGNKDDADVYLVKVDSEGNEIWGRTFGIQGNSINNEEGYSVQQTSDGGFIIAGETNSSKREEYDLHDVYIVKTDSGGNLIWNKTYGGDRDDRGYTVQETHDGNYIIVGETKSFGEPATAIYLIKIDSKGNEIWSRTFGDAAGDKRGYSVQETSDGGFIIAGMSWPLEQENPDFYLLKTDPNGNKIWSAGYTGPDGRWSRDWGRSVVETGDGGYIMVGETYSGIDRDQDILLVKTDSLGKLLWSRTCGGTDNEYGYSVLDTGDGGYIVAGSIKSSGDGEYDVYVAKTKLLLVNVSISCQTSVDTLKRGREVITSGVISPPIPGRTITITYTSPEGSETHRDVETDEEGAFSDRYSPNAPGIWMVAAHIEGDVYYKASSSEPVLFTVEEPQDTYTLFTYGFLTTAFVIIILAVWRQHKQR